MELNIPPQVPKKASQEDRYYWLKAFMDQNDKIRPTMRQMAKGWSVSVTSTSAYLDQMEEEGWVKFYRDIQGKRISGAFILAKNNA